MKGRRTDFPAAIQARYGIAKRQLQTGTIGSYRLHAYAGAMIRALAVTLLMNAAMAPAQTPTNADIRAVADAFDAAQQHQDRAALDALLAPDFLIVYGSGKVSGRADFIAGYTGPGMTLDPFVITDRMFARVSPDVRSSAVMGGLAVPKEAGASPATSAIPTRSSDATVNGGRSSPR